MKNASSVFLISSLCVSCMLTSAQNYQYGNSNNMQVKVSKSTPSSMSQYSSTAVESSYDSSNEFQTLNEVQTAIKNAYKNYNINISIMDGVITLTGMVKSENDKQNIEKTIENINGVKGVNNRLEVVAKTSSPDQY